MIYNAGHGATMYAPDGTMASKPDYSRIAQLNSIENRRVGLRPQHRIAPVYENHLDDMDYQIQLLKQKIESMNADNGIETYTFRSNDDFPNTFSIRSIKNFYCRVIKPKHPNSHIHLDARYNIFANVLIDLTGLDEAHLSITGETPCGSIQVWVFTDDPPKNIINMDMLNNIYFPANYFDSLSAHRVGLACVIRATDTLYLHSCSSPNDTEPKHSPCKQMPIVIHYNNISPHEFTTKIVKHEKLGDIEYSDGSEFTDETKYRIRVQKSELKFEDTVIYKPHFWMIADSDFAITGNRP